MDYVACRSLLRVLIVFSLFGNASVAQEKTAEAAEHDEEKSSRVEADFFMSDVLRSGTLSVRIWKELGFEGHYFGLSETNVGITGANWKFKWKGLEVMPGAGVGFGDGGVSTGAALTLRWLYERPRFLTEGMIVQSLSKSRVTDEHTHEHREFYATLLDNTHASARFKWFEIGPTIERIQYREDNEWKVGGRLAARVHKRISLVLMILAPGKTEFRGGIVYR